MDLRFRRINYYKIDIVLWYSNGWGKEMPIHMNVEMKVFSFKTIAVNICGKFNSRNGIRIWKLSISLLFEKKKSSVVLTMKTCVFSLRKKNKLWVRYVTKNNWKSKTIHEHTHKHLNHTCIKTWRDAFYYRFTFNSLELSNCFASRQFEKRSMWIVCVCDISDRFIHEISQSASRKKILRFTLFNVIAIKWL